MSAPISWDASAPAGTATGHDPEGRAYRVARHGTGRKYWDAVLPDGTSTKTTSLAAAKAACEDWEPDPTQVELTIDYQDMLTTLQAEYAAMTEDERATLEAHNQQEIDRLDAGEYDDPDEDAGYSSAEPDDRAGEPSAEPDDRAGEPSAEPDDELELTNQLLAATATVLEPDHYDPPQGSSYSYTGAGHEQRQALIAIRDLNRLRKLVEDVIAQQVELARTNTSASWYSNAATWDQVGHALGVTKQSASSKYGRKS